MGVTASTTALDSAVTLVINASHDTYSSIIHFNDPDIAMDELLITLGLIMSWYQHNLCHCFIASCTIARFMIYHTDT